MQREVYSILTIIFCSIALAAAVPSSFTVLDTEGKRTAKTAGCNSISAATFPSYRETDRDRQLGFKAVTVDLNYNLKKPFVWNGTELNHQLNLVSATNDYTSTGFSIFASRPLAQLEIEASPLKGPGIIAADQIRILQLAPSTKNPRFALCYCMLLFAPELNNLKAGRTSQSAGNVQHSPEYPGRVVQRRNPH